MRGGVILYLTPCKSILGTDNYRNSIHKPIDINEAKCQMKMNESYIFDHENFARPFLIQMTFLKEEYKIGILGPPIEAPNGLALLNPLTLCAILRIQTMGETDKFLDL